MSHPAMRQRGKHANIWARHPPRTATPLTCGEYLCLGTTTAYCVCLSLVLILVVKILGGGGTSSGLG
jgi:hypothetical protein